MLGVGRRGPLGRAEVEGAGGPRPGSGPGTWPATGPEVAALALGAQRASGSSRIGDREREAWVVLASADGVGPVTFGRLLAAYGSARGVLAAALGPAGAAGLVATAGTRDGGAWHLDPEAAAEVVGAARDAEQRLAVVRRAGVDVILLADDAYPSRLRAVELPPPVLFLRGSVAALDRMRAVAIVGTRRPTAAGRTMACRIAEAVGAHGATVVSGLALGIDGAAHATAVRNETPTVAVIGGGHARLYPAGHRGLAQQIVDGGGAVLSEFAPDTRPSRGSFPRRNRLISGLADATVVVEAGARSGALTTAAWALEQGRGLHLVPGRPDDPTVAGSLAFLREAGPEARVIAGVPELLEDLGYLDAGATHRGIADPLAELPSAERAIAGQLRERPATADDLADATGLAPATVLAALTGLEVRGLVVETFARYRATGLLEGTIPPRATLPSVGRGLRRTAA